MLRTSLQRAALRPSALSSSAALLPQRRAFHSREEVVKACRLIEKSPTEFIEKYVADDVLWTVTEPTGKSTPISGESRGKGRRLIRLPRSCWLISDRCPGMYKSRKDFMEKALGPLSESFAEPLKLNLGEQVRRA